MSLVWQDPESRAKSKPEISLPLFEQAHARNSDPKHSHEAAKSVSLTNLGRTRDRIIALLKGYGPMTDEQIAEVFRLHSDLHFSMASPSDIRSRRSELVHMGFVIEAGTGKTASGRPCAIWRLA